MDAGHSPVRRTSTAGSEREQLKQSIESKSSVVSLSQSSYELKISVSRSVPGAPALRVGFVCLDLDCLVRVGFMVGFVEYRRPLSYM